MHRRLSLALLFLAMSVLFVPATTVSADPGTPPPANALKPNQPFAIHFKDPATCTGFSYGGANGPMSAYGASYNDCEGNVVYQSADVHLIYCVAVIGGLCWPWYDEGTMTNGLRTFDGPGGFWTPEVGNATMGGLTPGYSYMVRTHLVVLLSDGTGGDGYSSSSIFTTPMP